jgi:hypothetical protein
LKVLGKGGLWNTFVLVARLDTLWRMGWRQFPEMMHRFERLLASIGTRYEEHVLESIYCDMPRYNFSTSLLEREIKQIGLMELEGVLWSDWGRPERIVETLHQIGGIPRFAPDLINLPNHSSLVGSTDWNPSKEPEKIFMSLNSSWHDSGKKCIQQMPGLY